MWGLISLNLENSAALRLFLLTIIYVCFTISGSGTYLKSKSLLLRLDVTPPAGHFELVLVN